VAKAQRREGTRRGWRLLVVAVLLLAGWFLVSHFVIRARIEAWLDLNFQGDARVKWAILWPDLDATAFGVEVVTEHHRLFAPRVVVGIRPWGLVAGQAVTGVRVIGLRGEFDEGQPVALLRRGEEGGGGDEAAPAPAPLRAPPLVFDGGEIHLRLPDGSARRVFRTARLEATQVGDLAYELRAAEGSLAGVPFEAFSGNLIPRAGHLLLSRLKLRAFNGMVAGMLDIDTEDTGAFNGEAEWRFVEVDRVWTTYGLPYAEKRRGDLSGSVVFEASRPSLDALKGKGELRLDNAAFFSPLSFKVFLVLKVPVAAEAPLTRGTMTFSVEDARFYLEAARFEAKGFELEGQGILSFAGGADLEVSHAGTVVAVSGRIEEPTITVLPLSALTAPVDRLFRERVR
jgi:hypothetical protein